MLVNEQKLQKENFMDSENYLKAFKNHLDNYFDENDEILVFHETESPYFHLDVHWIQPNEKRNHSILLTTGMGSMPFEISDKSSSKRVELCMLLPSDWKLEKNWKQSKDLWPIQLLRNLARYPVIHKTFFDYSHTITESQPFCIETKLISTILLKSKILPEGFQKIKYGEDAIEVYLVFPLYNEELRYRKENGTKKLIQLFERENISEIIDCNRKNVCENIDEEAKAQR
jgi:hypothetical protein